MTSAVGGLSQAKDILEKYETFLFDCDGVIWSGKEAVPGIDGAIARLQELGKRVLFVSNNSTKDRNLYLSKLGGMGIDNIDATQVFHSGYATAQYLKSRGLEGTHVYVVGEEGLKRELGDVVTVVAEDEDQTYDPDFEASRELPAVSAVVVGMDFTFNMKKLAKSLVYLNTTTDAAGKRPLFVLTNPDAVIPINGKAMPEAATIAAAITANACFPPDAVCGKPNPLLFNIIREVHPSVDPASTLMIGDRIDTDIRFGQASDLDTLLVLSGFQKLADVETSEHKPTYIFESVPSLVEHF